MITGNPALMKKTQKKPRKPRKQGLTCKNTDFQTPHRPRTEPAKPRKIHSPNPARPRRLRGFKNQTPQTLMQVKRLWGDHAGFAGFLTSLSPGASRGPPTAACW
jgi:hypothetical protein